MDLHDLCIGLESLHAYLVTITVDCTWHHARARARAFVRMLSGNLRIEFERR